MSPDVRTVDSAAYARRLGASFLPGEVVALDESDESLLLASSIGTVRDLTVLTTGLDVAQLLWDRVDVRVVLISGVIDRQTRSVVAAGPGSFALGRQISRGFFGGSSYSPASGLLERYPGLAHTKKLLADQCITCHGHIFASKVDHFALYTSVTFDRIAELSVINGEAPVPTGTEPVDPPTAAPKLLLQG